MKAPVLQHQPDKAQQPLYAVDNLTVDLYTAQQAVRAVDDCSFAVHAGETLAIVGESGSGKTVLTLGPLGLMPEGVSIDIRGAARTPEGDVANGGKRRRAGLLGKEFGVVFQDPSSALNPMRRIGPQLAAQSRRFGGVSVSHAKADAVAQLRRVGIADPESRYGCYPHELSGGMRQRAMIALALAGRPRVLLADEPTTALDATVQAQILDLLKSIQAVERLAVIVITHDIGVVAGLADRVAVMYAGRIVEDGDAVDVLKRPAHPYTQGLLASVPDMQSPVGTRLREIEGQPPDLSALRPGCHFAPRCFAAVDACRSLRPALAQVPSGARGHRVACPVIAGDGTTRATS